MLCKTSFCVVRFLILESPRLKISLENEKGHRTCSRKEQNYADIPLKYNRLTCLRYVVVSELEVNLRGVEVRVS